MPTVYYRYNVDVPPGTVTADHCSIPYKLVTTLTYLEVCGTPGPIAGYVEGPIIQFYRPVNDRTRTIALVLLKLEAYDG